MILRSRIQNTELLGKKKLSNNVHKTTYIPSREQTANKWNICMTGNILTDPGIPSFVLSSRYFPVSISEDFAFIINLSLYSKTIF